ncbi:MAG: ketoacyl-ACP synthase III [Dehalococcoidia bacterium]|nr:ketoacyl-ACP synthase III [Dehalococcoidia bacterium]
MTFFAKISATGAYLPEKVLTNFDLEQLVETNDEWIRERTGIHTRHIAAPNESSSSLGIHAATRALDAAGVNGKEIDLVLVGTCTPDGMFPSVASHIQNAVGAINAGAFDVNAACTGYLSALSTATQFIENGSVKKALVVGAETLSRIVDWSDRTTCVLFGDGAGATLLEASSEENLGSIRSFVLRSDGGQADALFAGGPGAPMDHPIKKEAHIMMDGRAVFRAAVEEMSKASLNAIHDAGLSLDDISLLVPHQANERIIRALARNLNFPMEKVFMNVEKYGNTSSATIPIALHEANTAGLIKPGDYVLMTVIGGGLAWGAMVVQWSDYCAS